MEKCTMEITKQKFLSIYTPENRYNDDTEYTKLNEYISIIIKKELWHSDKYYINDVYYNQKRQSFEVEIYETNEVDFEKGIYNDNDPENKYYDIEQVLALINKYKSTITL